MFSLTGVSSLRSGPARARCRASASASGFASFSKNGFVVYRFVLAHGRILALLGPCAGALSRFGYRLRLRFFFQEWLLGVI
jgi:hypothetical protein